MLLRCDSRYTLIQANQGLKEPSGGSCIAKRLVCRCGMKRYAKMFAERRKLEVSGSGRFIGNEMPHRKLHRTKDKAPCWQIDL